ncbi:conserved hypothetical protein [Candidatus Sulfopaludibacter sp. SbA4]|nr:conserved hypothetical protein [Candidatus Sulfopaludibacter sp. SbA4]
MTMSAGTPILIEEYLKTSYRPDREYRDGLVTERNVGELAHSMLQGALAAYLGNRRKQWQIAVYMSLRIRVRAEWYAVPDVCIYPLPAPKERFPSTLPLLWIEILSEDDRMIDVWKKAADLISCGVPNVWIIDPHTLESELWTAAGGPNPVPDKTLRIAGTPIVIPLLDVMEE